MKKLVVIVSCLLAVIAKSQAIYTMVEYNKNQVPAITYDMPFEESTVKDALLNFYEKLGYKSKKVKSFTMYSAVNVTDFGPMPHDLYFMVDRRSRQDKKSSTLTILVSNGYENFVSDVDNPALINAVKEYAVELREIVAEYDLELQIQDQEGIVKKEEKKYIGLQEDAVDLAKKKKKVEEQIAQNIVDQARQSNEKDRQIQILENLRNKRKKQ